MKVVLDDTAKEQINNTIECIKTICDMQDDCTPKCPFCVIEKPEKIPICRFSVLPYKWDSIE